MDDAKNELFSKIAELARKYPALVYEYQDFLSLKAEDLSSLQEFLNEHGLKYSIKLHAYLNNLLTDLPPGSRIRPQRAIAFIVVAAGGLSIDCTDIMAGLNKYLDVSKDMKIFNDFFKHITPAIEEFREEGWKDSYAKRNSRLMTNIVTATDLRAVYKKDFSPATEIINYDPSLDIKSFVPVAKIRIFFDTPLDYYDFSCDINMVDLLIHSLTHTKNQLNALSEVASIIQMGDDDGAR